MHMSDIITHYFSHSHRYYCFGWCLRCTAVKSPSAICYKQTYCWSLCSRLANPGWCRLEFLSYHVQCVAIILLYANNSIILTYAVRSWFTCGLPFWNSQVNKTLRKLRPSIPLNFDVHVTVHLDNFFIIEPTRCTNSSKFFLFWN